MRFVFLLRAIIDLPHRLSAWLQFERSLSVLLSVLLFNIAVQVELQSQVMVHEVCSRNDDTLVDEDGEYPDWVELYNAGSASVNLNGYALSDDPKNPQRWIFPSRTLTAKGYTVIFLSGKNRTNGTSLHANFSLRLHEEQLVLTSAEGIVLDRIGPVEIPNNFSYGRRGAGGGEWLYFARPTPRAFNATPGFTSFAPAPVLEPLESFEPTPRFWSVTNTFAGATYWNSNGAIPTSNDLQFLTPVAFQDLRVASNVLSMIKGTATINQHTDGWFPPSGLVSKLNVLRLRNYLSNAWPSPVITRSVSVATNLFSHYHLPVLSLVTDTNGLFNYRTGIYVLGKTFDDYVATHPGEALTGHTPANYTQRGKAWERLASLEYFDEQGQRRFQQDVKIDIQGQSTRSFRQKPLGLKSRSDFSPVDRFNYELFPGLTNRQGRPIREFAALRLRNSGNDWAYTLMRDALAHELVKDTSIDTETYSPVVAFLNGEFWGVYDMREQEDRSYLESHYDVPRVESTICQANGQLVDGYAGTEQHYLELVNYVSGHDLSVSNNFQWVSERMDIQQFKEYQIAEIYFGNADWPHNNIRFWRCTHPNFAPDAPYGHDGRWRWLLFDVDLGLSHPWSGGYGDNTLAAAISPTGRPGLNAPWSTLLLRSLMKNSAFREDFINSMANALNSRFRENRVLEQIQRMQITLAPAMFEQIKRWRTMGDATNGWNSQLQILKLFASQRPINVRQHFMSTLGIAGYSTLTLDVTPKQAGMIQLHDMTIGPATHGLTNSALPYPWRGSYFRNVPIEAKALAAPGYRFVRWQGVAADTATNRAQVVLKGSTNLIAVFEPDLAVHQLSSGPYRFDEWSPDSAPGTVPNALLFELSDSRDPGSSAGLNGLWSSPYDLTSRSRVNGLGIDGVALLNTSQPQDEAHPGYVAAVTLSLSTLQSSNIQISWISQTLNSNQQPYALQLQVADQDGAFRNVNRADQGSTLPVLSPVRYVSEMIPGPPELIGPYLLPESGDAQSLVRVRWRFQPASGSGGPRAQVRLDDIDIRTVPSQSLHPLKLEISMAKTAPFKIKVVVQCNPRQKIILEHSTDLISWIPEEEGFTTDMAGVSIQELASDQLRSTSAILFIRAVTVFPPRLVFSKE